MAARLIILTGASGAGKTTMARHIAQHDAARCETLFFDSIGIPSTETMERDYGSGKAWQRAMTLQWMTRLRPMLCGQKPLLFEGQIRIEYLHETLLAQQIANAHIILVDCDDTTRTARLHNDRLQPELANPEMMNWAGYLREEALHTGTEILDTSQLSFDRCIDHLRLRLYGTDSAT